MLAFCLVLFWFRLDILLYLTFVILMFLKIKLSYYFRVAI